MYTRPKRTFVMVRIPAGEFIMGSPHGHGETDEFPAHPVYVDEFLIGRYLVTAAEWARFLNEQDEEHPEYFQRSSATTVTLWDGRCHPRRGCSHHPANGVTWFGAAAYCKWLSDKTGQSFRLPTEAEWEKAARGGMENQRYPWGNYSAEGMAWYGHVWSDPKHSLAPVGAYPPNAYGLYDMAGNVWEWCSDWYDRNYYHESPYHNPSGPEKGAHKAIRGGSWGGLDIQIRCAIRVGEDPELSEPGIGFRVARSV